MNIKTQKLKFFLIAAVFSGGELSSASAADMATVSAIHQVHEQTASDPFRDPGAFGMDRDKMSASTDPHPDTSFPETMRGTQADTEFGRNVASGSSQVKLLDATAVTVVGDFQSVVNRLNSTGTSSGRINQLQTQINQNQLQASYIFNEKFGITSATDGAGNLVGQASGTFIGTMSEYDGKKVVTVTCRGTFTYDLTDGYTLTSGSTQIWKGSGCNAQ